MSNRYAKKADRNQPAIVALMKEVGATVQHTHHLGQGFPDLVVGYQGRTYLVEIKTEDGDLTPREAEWHEWWKGEKVWIIRREIEVLEMFGIGT